MIQRITQMTDWNVDLIIDVRSPGEFNHAHIPGAINIPLFDDEERAVVGTAYKQESRSSAIKIGLDYFGPKMGKIIAHVEEELAIRFAKDKRDVTDSGHFKLLVHCWRGGMRSGGVAWLLDLYGFQVSVLDGGYKAYRQWVLAQFHKPYQLHMLSGNTGAAKTRVLHQMALEGSSVIDLEAIACHKGSAFGNIGMPDQPSGEMFENLLAKRFYEEAENVIWLEDESMRLGHVNIPNALWDQMIRAKIFILDIPFEERLKYTVAEYGSLPVEKMVNAIIRIRKKLGGLETQNAINFLIENEVADSFRILLKYYDKLYKKALENKQVPNELITMIPCDDTDAVKNAKRVLEAMGDKS
ncbi:MAG: tRNA 2-selenouridine(34) synthase MnmH [Saprospiraceae bacterium]|nr:tRNA 2-selenouridine(34) synthase MnmH [Saprospiraceae bacterium]